MKKSKNPVKMVRDPYVGDSFVFPETICTRERKSFFKRINEIHALLYITKHAYDETKAIYENRIPKLSLKENTPIKITLSTGNSIIFPANSIIKLTSDGINILTRQAFIMFYGAFETYLFQLFERSFPNIGIEKEILDRSVEILMGGKWDTKFNKMSSCFGLDFKAGKLNDHFTDYELNFTGEILKSPLAFLDELANVRHRIVHASSIFENDQLVSVDLDIFHTQKVSCNVPC
jgi:hypothetical protein